MTSVAAQTPRPLTAGPGCGRIAYLSLAAATAALWLLLLPAEIALSLT